MILIMINLNKSFFEIKIKVYIFHNDIYNYFKSIIIACIDF